MSPRRIARRFHLHEEPTSRPEYCFADVLMSLWKEPTEILRPRLLQWSEERSKCRSGDYRTSLMCLDGCCMIPVVACCFLPGFEVSVESVWVEWTDADFGLLEVD